MSQKWGEEGRWCSFISTLAHSFVPFVAFLETSAIQAIIESNVPVINSVVIHYQAFLQCK